MAAISSAFRSQPHRKAWVALATSLLTAAGLTMSYPVLASDRATDALTFDQVFSDSFSLRTVGAVELFPRIEVISDNLIFFTDAGQSQDVTVAVFDEDGEEIPDASVSVSYTDIEHTADFDLFLTGPRTIRIDTLRTFTGQRSITISYPELGITRKVWVAMGVPGPRTRLIDSDWVIDIQGNPEAQHSVILQRSSETEAIQVDDLIVSGDAVGVMANVLSISTEPDRLVLIVEPAPINEAFESLSLSLESEPLEVRVSVNSTTVNVTIRSLRDGVRLRSKTLRSLDLTDLLRCRGGLSAGDNLDVSAFEFIRQIQSFADLELGHFSVERFESFVSGTIGLDAGLQVNVGSQFEGTGECIAELPELNLSNIPLKAFFIRTSLDQSVGLRLNADAAANGLIQTPRLSRRWILTGGIRYTEADGWAPISESSIIDNSVEAFGVELEGSVVLSAGFLANVNFNKDFRIGRGRFSRSLIKAETARLEGGLTFDFGLASPTNPAAAAYTGPQWGAGVDYLGRLSFKSDSFQPLGNRLGVSLDVISQ